MPNASIISLNSSLIPHPPPRPPWIITIPESQRMSFILCYALILILSVLGNTSIIAVVARNPSMRTTINYLIANMAATDLASTISVTARVFSILHNLSIEFQVSGVLGSMFCKLGPYIRDVSISVSFHSMVAIAFDRFFAVVFPMRPTPRLLDLRILLPIIWFLSLGTFTVHLINYKLISPVQGVHICSHEWPAGVDQLNANTIFYLSILTVFWLLPLTAIAILYTAIALKMRRQTIPGQQSSQAERARRKQNKNIVKMAFVIVFCFFLCWIPHHVFVLMNLFVWKGRIPNGVDPRLFFILQDAITLITYLSFAINPYICFTFSSRFRTCFKNLFPVPLCFSTRVAPGVASSQGTSTTGHHTMTTYNKTTSKCHHNTESL